MRAIFVLMAVAALLAAPGCTRTTKAEASPVGTSATPMEAPAERPPRPVDLSGYSLSCSVDADCVVVHPQPCAKCGCADTPLAAAELERFRAAKGAVECPVNDPWPDIDCGSCMPMEPHCNAGTCSARPPA